MPTECTGRERRAEEAEGPCWALCTEGPGEGWRDMGGPEEDSWQAC